MSITGNTKTHLKRRATMLFARSVSKVFAGIVTASLLTVGLPAHAKGIARALPIAGNDDVGQSIVDAAAQGKPVSIAHAACSCGAELDALILAQADERNKSKSLLTDSLWGNLILELAYERDAQLNKLAKKVRLMNLGTTASIFGIAGGTLAQGIYALAVLNPGPTHQDSYVPLEIGTVLSGVTLAVLTARGVIGHELARHIRQRQFQIRDDVQAVLSHLEYSQGQCEEARAQLQKLIGQRACNEWIQLWQSSHDKLAQRNNREISIRDEGQANLAESVR